MSHVPVLTVGESGTAYALWCAGCGWQAPVGEDGTRSVREVRAAWHGHLWAEALDAGDPIAEASARTARAFLAGGEAFLAVGETGTELVASLNELAEVWRHV